MATDAPGMRGIRSRNQESRLRDTCCHMAVYGRSLLTGLPLVSGDRIALDALRLIEATVNANRAGEAIRGPTILDQMRQLHSALLLYPGKREAVRVLETPEKTQSEVLSAFGTG